MSLFSDESLLGGLDSLDSLALHEVEIEIVSRANLLVVALANAVFLNWVHSCGHVANASVKAL